jgi:peptidoglycan/LPS O-acetylase OafA/YrhL
MSERNGFIDRLRGLAILIVLLGHSLRYGHSWVEIFPAWFEAYVSDSSFYGVSIFFAISGYLITSKFITPESSNLRVEMRDFYIKRIGRIVPPLMLLMVTSAAIATAMGASVGVANLAKGALWILQFDFGSASTVIPHTQSSWDPLWSLSVEETFYVFLPLIALLAVSTRTLAACLITAVIAGLFYKMTGGNPYAFFGAFDQLAIGGLAAIYTPALRTRLSDRSSQVLRWLGLAAIAVLYFTKPFSQTYWTTCVAVAAIVYIVGSPTKPIISSPLLHVIERFGILSYEIYLFHMVVFWATDFLAHAFHSTFLFGVVNWTVLGVRVWLIYFVSSLIAKHYSEPANTSIRNFLNGRSPLDQLQAMRETTVLDGRATVALAPEP